MITDASERALIAARWTQGFAQWNRALKLPKDMPKERQQLISKGEDIFYQICVSCHGRIAEVLSFIRYAWGNEASSVTKDEVTQFRNQHKKRPAPWTDEELKALGVEAK